MEGSNHPIIDSILHGCNLAKKLESELLMLMADHPPTELSQKCEEIIEAFRVANQHIISSYHPLHFDQQEQPSFQAAEMAGVMFEHAQHLLKGKGKEAANDENKQLGRMQIDGSSGSAQLPKNPKRSSRNEQQEGNRRVRMAAPLIGNTEMPPEDNFTWRKYGQKEILNAKYPRSYYRCTHQKLYNCPAKKQVQRLDDDPSTFDILYRGDHTCHMSNTAPSIPPPPSQSQAAHQPIPISSSFHQWLSLDNLTGPSFVAANTIFHPQQLQQQQEQLYGVSSSSSILGNATVEAGPSTVGSHQGREQAVDLISPLLDWTEVFNSGSSSSNSMDVIFPSSNDRND